MTGALGGNCVAGTGDFESYGYDTIGNRITLRKRDGSLIGYQYDAFGRVTRKTVPERSGLSAAQTRDVYYDYDVRGLQTRARFDSLSGEGITNAYDGLGRLLTATTDMGGTTRTLAFAYNADGTRQSLTHADGATFGFEYDPAGRMTHNHEVNGVVSIDDLIVRYWYYADGKRYAAVRGAGSIGFTTILYYDPIMRLNAVINDLPVAGADVSINLASNTASQIARRILSNDAYAWTGAANHSLAYQVNGLNQYTAASNRTYDYDPNGNLIADGTTSYLYDVENRLVSASGATNASLVYDPLGRLFQTSGGGAGTTRFLYDGDALVAEYDGSGALTRRYVHGPGVDDPVVVYEGPARGLANRRYTMPDERGSIAALVNADGSPSVINTYDPWGIPGAANQGRFQYTGQAWIPELGMYHYKARIYSPILGRFLQTDPVGYKDQVNLYAYVGNDPLNHTDPSGLAELNLVGAEDYTAENIDMQGAFTISAHGSPLTGGVANTKGDNYIRLSPKQLLTLAEARDYKQGTLTFLMACYPGLTGRWFSPSFAQEYAEASRGPVVASPGQVDAFANSDAGRIDLRSNKGFFLYQKGHEPQRIGNRIVYDVKTGITRIYTDRIGTRLSGVKTECTDPEKCGKRQ